MICYHRQLRILVARGPRPEYDETIKGSLYKMETFSMTTDIRIFWVKVRGLAKYNRDFSSQKRSPVGGPPSVSVDLSGSHTRKLRKCLNRRT